MKTPIALISPLLVLFFAGCGPSATGGDGGGGGGGGIDGGGVCVINENVETSCFDNQDNDCDGARDCADSDCAFICDDTNLPDAAVCDETIFPGDPLAIPDNLNIPYETSLTITGFQAGQTLTDIAGFLGACVTMEHSWLRDLQIELICPSGQITVMQEMLGTVGSELFMGIPYELDEGQAPIPGTGYEYCWRPAATNPPMLDWANINMAGGGTLPADDYAASDGYANLVGCELNGTWTIRVTDLWGIDNGVIFGWSIEFDGTIFPECLDVIVE